MKISSSSLALYQQCVEAFKKKAKGDRGVHYNASSRSGVVAHAIWSDMLGGNEVAHLNPPISMEEHSDAMDLLHRFDVNTLLRGGIILATEVLYETNITGEIVLAKVDLLIRHLDESLEVIDLKTGWKSSDPSEDSQGIFAAYTTAKNYGATEVKFTKYFVRYNDFRSQTYGPADFEKFENYIKLVGPLMRSELMEKEEENEHSCKNFGAHCVKCPYVLTCNLNEHEMNALSAMSPEKLEEAIWFFDAKKKAAENSLKSIIRNTPEQVVRTNTSEYRLKTGKVFKVDPKSEKSKERFISEMVSTKTGRDQIVQFLSINIKDCVQLARARGVKVQEQSQTRLERVDLVDVEDDELSA